MYWKLYIDSPQKRALDFCGGSLATGKGCGYGNGCVDDGGGHGSGDGGGDGAIDDGDGVSPPEWV